jgi:hypothetical protein
MFLQRTQKAAPLKSGVMRRERRQGGKMSKYFSDDDMLKKSQFFAFACIGGMTEGFDYSEARALCKYWGEKRRENHYHGGYAEEITGQQALRLQHNNALVQTKQSIIDSAIKAIETRTFPPNIVLMK